MKSSMKKLLFLCGGLLILSTSFIVLLSHENLGYLSTEKHNPVTASLSSIMHKDCVQGLKLLHQVDKQHTVAGIYEFAHTYYAQLTELVTITRANKGRCFLVGAGSSGRIAIDIASRCCNDIEIVGIMAGGDSAFICAREGFEDSESAGHAVMCEYAITPHDFVILISASGSASFNVGCAVQARKVGAKVCYLYNSAQVPAKTQTLFDQFGVIPVVIDSGPQAITGSTRLQAASIARLALGTLFGGEQPHAIIEGLAIANNKIAENLHDIAQIIQLEHAVLAHPQSNFRKIKDETTQGYVTFVGDKTVLRDIVMDAVETAPTFSTNPPRMVNEVGKKKAEFQAYLIGENDNLLAWQTLVGRSINRHDVERSLQFSVTENALCMRPLGEGNMVIGVAWHNPAPLMATLAQARAQGAKTALILLSDATITDRAFDCDACVVLDDLPQDAIGLIAAITLKQVLNMISNGTMILMNKVEGNQMIDVNASNNKLVDRAIRLTQEVFAGYSAVTHEYENIAISMREILDKKKEYEVKNMYTPSPVKIAVAMLFRGVNFEDAVTLLHDYEENLERICS
jgi:N-acetylmuramic acid 6-phosphate etherase